MNTKLPHIVSFSGGRTSAYLVHLMESKRKELGLDVRYVFMDTGAEADETYEFIKQVVAHYKIDLVCLRVVVNPKLRQANSYERISIDDICNDLKPFAAVMAKYGTPYVRGPFCTLMMKGVATSSGTYSGPFYQYANDTFGKGNYVSLLGIRIDEPKRIIGDDNLANLSKKGFTPDEAIDLKDRLIEMANEQSLAAVEEYVKALYATELQDDLFSQKDEEQEKKIQRKINLLVQRIGFLASGLIKYMADFSDFERDDVLRFWQEMPFDLQIDEWLGNCVFCIKKGPNKLALAARDKPEQAAKWIAALHSNDVADKERKYGKLIMYRGDQSLEQIIKSYSHLTRDEIAASVRSSKQTDANSCSESCEALTCDVPIEFTLEQQIDGQAA